MIAQQDVKKDEEILPDLSHEVSDGKKKTPETDKEEGKVVDITKRIGEKVREKADVKEVTDAHVEKPHAPEEAPVHEKTSVKEAIPINKNAPVSETVATPAPAATVVAPRQSFGKELVEQFKETGRLYKEILFHPTLIVKGLGEVARDLFWNLPKSIFSKKQQPDKQKYLEEKMSQAIGVGEVMSFPGMYAGIAALSAMGVGAMVAGPLGAMLGSYFASVISSVGSYMFFTRKRKADYSRREAGSDCLKVMRDCLPSVAVMYATDAPLIAGLVALGLSANVAATVVTVIGMAIFTGIAKISAKKAVKKKQEEANAKANVAPIDSAKKLAA